LKASKIAISNVSFKKILSYSLTLEKTTLFDAINFYVCHQIRILHINKSEITEKRMRLTSAVIPIMVPSSGTACVGIGVGGGGTGGGGAGGGGTYGVTPPK
jgi:uncharacterized membrane protein